MKGSSTMPKTEDRRPGREQVSYKPVPQRLVVLTFDDAVSNHATFVAPLLKRLGFGATFYVCEFPPDFETNKTQYMTWEQIRWLHDAGFEIGNHTGRHVTLARTPLDAFGGELEYIERRCEEYGIDTPTTFCYPECATSTEACTILRNRGYRFARTGGDRPYVPAVDDPLLVPSFAVHGDSEKPFLDAVAQAHDGRIVVLMFHGVPEHTHPWVNTPPELFEHYMQYLHDNNCAVMAFRDLGKYAMPATQLREETVPAGIGESR